MWCLPPAQDARFVAAMEDVLEVYARPFNPLRPLVCLDEAAKQLLGEKRPPLPATSEHPARYDNQYTRNGTCALFMLFQPLAALRHVLVKDRRTAVDYAQVVRYLCDEVHPYAERIILVQDNLNTHGAHSLYEAFAPCEARRLAERIEWHFTPKHASWLNMAEMELSVLARQCLQERSVYKSAVFTRAQCLQERMECKENLERQINAWQERRNQSASRVNWHFTTKDARVKLHKLYPEILPG